VADQRRSSGRRAADQHRHGQVGQVQSELGGVVAGVEHKQRHPPVGVQAVKQCTDLRGGGLVVSSNGCRRRVSTGAVQESRSKLSWQIHWKAQPAMIG